MRRKFIAGAFLGILVRTRHTPALIPVVEAA
jgi:hypothetical protein